MRRDKPRGAQDFCYTVCRTVCRFLIIIETVCDKIFVSSHSAASRAHPCGDSILL